MVPPVQAQTAYTNGSISGTYSIYLSLGGEENIIGSFKADGNGNITGGVAQVYVESNPVCPSTFTGTYAIQSDATGTGTVTVTVGTAPACSDIQAGAPLTFSLQAAQQGATLLYVESDGIAGFSGTASKQ